MNLAIKNERYLKEKYQNVDLSRIINEWIKYYTKNHLKSNLKESG